ncbi:hypothetical protein PTKIN_Ptkin04bG0141000 [Pterospermum kingtungense]
MPQVFCIGPLFDTNNGTSRGNDDGDNEGAECLKWLDSQPSKSVVFLCFGSMGLFSKKQLMEIAIGLEKSGQRGFLESHERQRACPQGMGTTGGEEMKLAVAVNKSEKGLVSAEEVEKRVRELMETEEGKLMRDRAMAMKNEAAAAFSEAGSSLAALAQLVKCWAQK